MTSDATTGSNFAVCEGKPALDFVWRMLCVICHIEQQLTGTTTRRIKYDNGLLKAGGGRRHPEKAVYRWHA